MPALMLVNDGFPVHRKTALIVNRATILEKSLQSHGKKVWGRGLVQSDPLIGKDIMASAYVVAPIKAAQVERAYCLIDAAGYDIGLDAWRQICAAALARKYSSPFVEEIAVAENSLGYVKGIAILQVSHHERLGRYLSVPVFVIASAGDTRGVCGSLLRYLSAMAFDRHCGAIRVATLAPDRWPVANGSCDEEPDGIVIPLR